MKSNFYRVLAVALSALFGASLAAALASAATTISTNIQTDGALSATATTTLLGNTLIGTSTPSGNNNALYISDTNPYTPVEIHSSYALGIDMYTSAAAGFRAPVLGFFKSRGTQFAPTGISNGDELGYINFSGVDSGGGNYATGGSIVSQSSVTWTPSDHSSEIIFSTAPAGSTAVGEVFRMGSNADAGDATANISYLNLIVSNNLVLGWSATNGDGSPDTGFSRLKANVVAVGNGTANDTTGTLVAAKVGVGTTTPYSKFQVTSGANATTTVNFGEVGVSTSHACFNTKNTAGTDISFYFVGTTMVVENNLCR